MTSPDGRETFFSEHTHTEECALGMRQICAHLHYGGDALANEYPNFMQTGIAAYSRSPNSQRPETITRQLVNFVSPYLNFSFAPEDLDSLSISEEQRREIESTDPAELAASRLILAAMMGASSIDAVKVERLGRNASTTASNGLIIRFLGELVYQIGSQDFDFSQVDQAISHLGSSIEEFADPSNHARWYIVKLRILREVVMHYQLDREIISSLAEADKPEAVIQLKKDNDHLFDTISYLKRYTLKPCIAPSFRTVPNVQEWKVTASVDSKKVAGQPSASAIGEFNGSPIRIKDGTTESYKLEAGEGLGLHVRRLNMEIMSARFLLGADGDLYTPSGQLFRTIVPPEKQLAFENIRSEILCLYHDLVVPIYVTEMADEEATKRLEPANQLSERKTTAKTNKLRRLVLARSIISQELKEEIISAIVAEKKLSRHEAEKRAMVKHEVVGHIRLLPADFRASPEARELCLTKLGVVLADYAETYVDNHERGSLSDDRRGHRATLKRGASVTKHGLSSS